MVEDTIFIEQALDSLSNVPQAVSVFLNTSSPIYKSILDDIYKIATVIIASFNAWFAYVIFKLKNKKEDETKEADRKLALMKTLVLDYNLKHMYSFFDDLIVHLNELKQKNANKKDIEQHIQTDFKSLNESFINLLAAIDLNLHSELLQKSDNFRDKLVENIGDEGINLYVSQKYSELIEDPYCKFKQDMISCLFNYKGK
ncbi:hypothetical protein [Caecibacteroides pullorum]|uniref:Uncharacterized protein n=1 Tax=Caecibacteroides pullorum TaxID=2725562 RepID=A0AA40ZS60_9BACT|nr:hypothetical protein [Caecibacteroides pullorum]MBM6856617.1 hypothetical protein [Caecibacteroides pullorum]MBV8057623.1 hypothetical protein [Caecibacteroides pullorum]